MKNALPPQTLVLGGASCGKSAHAEELVCATARPRRYIATAQAFDDEMRAKIDAHCAARGPDWDTWECPQAPWEALAPPAEAAVLLDCATLWLSNRLLAGADLEAESQTLLTALAACPAPVVVVSNEVGLSVVPETKLGRAFRTAQGQLNQRLAAQADRVILVTAGLPTVLK